jgi:signal transduction histidine kinase
VPTDPRGAPGYSLRRRLLLAVCGAAAVAWIFAAQWMVHESLEETARSLDAELVETGHLVLAFAANEAGARAADWALERERAGRGRHERGADDGADHGADHSADDGAEGGDPNPGAAGGPGNDGARPDDAGRIHRGHADGAVGARPREPVGNRAARDDGQPGVDGDIPDRLARGLRQAHPHDEHLYYQVRGPSGRLVVRSPGAPDAGLADLGARGLQDRVIEGADWRVFSQFDAPSGLTVHVGEPAARRSNLEREALAHLVPPGIGLLLALALATAWSTHRVLRPVEQAALRIDRLAPGEPGAIDAAGLPREIAPLVDAIARLQQRVHQALLHERTLTADAAHELRTPLAALRAQAQWAQRAPDAPQRDRALQAVMQAADRCARLADAVLTLARLDAAAFDPVRQPGTGLDGLVRLALHDVAHAADARGVRIEAALLPVTVRADPDALAVAVRNLLDNAVRFAVARVALTMTVGTQGAAIEVRDDGPGIEPAEQARLFDRFWRGPGSEGGSGLGLAMVQRVARLHGATVEMVAGLDGRGFGIRFTLPADLCQATPDAPTSPPAPAVPVPPAA